MSTDARHADGKSNEQASRGRGRGHGEHFRRGGQGNIQPRGGRGRGGNPHSVAGEHAPQKPAVQRPRPTHFLCIPLGHHPKLRERMSAFQQALLKHSPKIPGLDERILVSPRRLHLTLGVMNLMEFADPNFVSRPGHPSTSSRRDFPPDTNPQEIERPVITQVQTVQSAIKLLNGLKPRIMEELGGEDLRVGLKFVDIMRPDRGDLTQAHVMWAGPSYEDEHAKRLKRVCELVQKEFQKAGLVTDERRALKLHCTVINTSYRQGRRQPFSYADVIASSAFRSIERGKAGKAEISGEARGRRPIPVDLGEWTAGEIQVCKMGSWGPEGEYVSVSKIHLV